jgi:MFS family permease
LASEQDTKAPPRFRIAAMASVGAAIEWYDFFIYGTAAALVFPHLFFPPDLPPLIAQLAAFSTFAVGFIARPIGGMVFGHFGDLHGRKNALVIAMLIMGGATTLIGLLPTYQMVGNWAPVSLVILRFLQGLAVGGQWGGAALLAIESAKPKQQGFLGSFVQMGVPLGVVLANSVFLVLSATIDSESFLAWGWRIGFVISIALIFVALWMQHIVEPGENERKKDDAPAPPPLLVLIREHSREVLLAGGAFVANNTGFYIAITYAVAYGATTLGIARETMLFGVMIGSLVMMPALVVCGALSDRFGRRGIFMLGAILSGVWAFAFFPLVDHGSLASVSIAITVELIFISMMYGPQAAMFAELFPKSVRYSGASLGYQIGTVAGGGLAPIIATALFARYESTAPIAIYLCAMCAITVVCVMLLGRKRHDIG